MTPKRCRFAYSFASRCTVQAEIYLGQEIAATATQVGFFMSLKTMRPIAMPEEFKEIYAEYD
jgi:acyl-CoA thioester hydrolase